MSKNVMIGIVRKDQSVLAYHTTNCYPMWVAWELSQSEDPERTYRFAYMDNPENIVYIPEGGEAAFFEQDWSGVAGSKFLFCLTLDKGWYGYYQNAYTTQTHQMPLAKFSDFWDKYGKTIEANEAMDYFQQEVSNGKNN